PPARKMTAVGMTTDYDRLKDVKEFDEARIGVKGLSDSGITTIPRIFIHPPENLPASKSPSSYDGIPVIDLSGINDAVHGRPQIVQQVKEAAKEWGFFQLINHGVPLTEINDTISAFKSFHAEPLESRAKHYVRGELSGVAYTSNNDLYRSKAASWHDYVQVWRAPEVSPVDEIPAAFRKEVVAWDGHVAAVAGRAAELLADGLGLHGGRPKELGYLETRLWVGVYYPYCPQPDLTMGLSHHTDPGVLTVLVQNEVGGLQVKHGEEWVDVKPIKGSLIVNIGDFLQIVSNGEYNSVQHRVLANANKEPRISIVEFFNFGIGDGSKLYGPIPELLSPEKPALYRTFTKQEFDQNFFSKGLDSKSLVEKLWIEG
ncbi:hypothetical protein RJ640_021815, partial [Escallonia rubra]